MDENNTSQTEQNEQQANNPADEQTATNSQSAGAESGKQQEAEKPAETKPDQPPKPDESELTAFREWQKDKAANEKLLADTQAAAKAAEEKAQATEARNIALMSGVKADALDDALRCALPRVNEKVTLQQAIGEVLGKYPQFRNFPASIGAKTLGDSGGDDEMARRVMGLPPKKQ